MKITAQRSEARIKKLGVRGFVLNPKSKLPYSSYGFTLIEVLVAATILATLAGGVLLTLNPIAQINKSQDAQRMSDLQALKTALDLYYNDNGCYPTVIPFGEPWVVRSTVYMQETPQDPRASDTDGISYRYRTDSDNPCPQWNVVFAELSRNSEMVDACPLSSLSNCTPEGYEEGRFACVLSGGVDCTDLLASSLLGGIETVTRAPTPTPGPPTPTPTLGPNDQVIPLPEPVNPNADEVILNHGTNSIRGNPGAAQTVRVDMDDPGVEITEVTVVFTHDTGQRSVPLNPPTGSTNNAGIWQAASVIGNDETYCNLYGIEVFMTAGSGTQIISSVEGINLIATGLLGQCE